MALDFRPPYSDYVKHEYDAYPNFCREEVVIATPSNLKAGTVVAKVTASGKYVQVDLAASDGSENAAGILINDADATTADVRNLIVARGPAVATSNLIYPTGASAANIATINAALAAKSIVVRDAI